MERDEINRTAADALNKAESGDKAGLSNELNNIPFQDRLEVVKAMKDLADQQHAKNPNLPQLEFSVTKDVGGMEHVTGIDLKSERAWYNPLRLVSEYSREDVYTPPNSELGTGLLSQVADSIRSQNQQAQQILDDMNKR